MQHIKQMMENLDSNLLLLKPVTIAIWYNNRCHTLDVPELHLPEYLAHYNAHGIQVKIVSDMLYKIDQ